MGVHIDVVIPALNEAAVIAEVVGSIPRDLVRDVIVADNGSTDGTGDIAAAAGARVVREPERGYGAACLRAIAAIQDDCDIVLFMDGDGADHPDYIGQLVGPIAAGTADIVIGSRALGANLEPGSITPQQRLGNAIASFWLRHRFDLPATDLGPFRAINYRSLQALGMADRNYGWTVEMQIKAARAGLRYREVAVPYRARTGKSKVSGTLRGVVGAGYKIIGTLAYHDLRGARVARGLLKKAHLPGP